MLRCLKWLPFACLGLFAVCCLIGYKLVPDKPPVKADDVIMSLTIWAFDINGNHITDVKTLDNSGTDFPKWEKKWKKGVDGPKETIVIKPGASAPFTGRPEHVQWRTREQFLVWLDSDFQQELRTRRAKMDAWTPVLKELRKDAGNAACIYPVILEHK